MRSDDYEDGTLGEILVYCDDCDDFHWLPNDEPDATEEDFPWKPCPWCNKHMRYPPPVFEEVGP